MIKGCEKRIIFLESTKSKYFDQAYLVIKDDLYTCDEGKILDEAERIIFGAESCKRLEHPNRNKRILKNTLIFSIGFLFGLMLAFSLAFILI